jgi:hypothetical protein
MDRRDSEYPSQTRPTLTQIYRDMQVTYNIRVDSRDPETIWVDQLAGGELDRTYGPFWSIYSARELIKRWQQEAV